MENIYLLLFLIVFGVVCWLLGKLDRGRKKGLCLFCGKYPKAEGSEFCSLSCEEKHERGML